MKTLALILILSLIPAYTKTTSVRPHVTRKGTYVKPHARTSPNGSPGQLVIERDRESDSRDERHGRSVQPEAAGEAMTRRSTYLLFSLVITAAVAAVIALRAICIDIPVLPAKWDDSHLEIIRTASNRQSCWSTWAAAFAVVSSFCQLAVLVEAWRAAKKTP